MQLRSIDPRTLAFNPDNPRRSPGNEAADRQLADSIRIVGILQPPIVKATQDGLEIVYGERRTRAAIAVGLEAIDVLVDDRNEADQAMAAIVENVVRAPLLGSVSKLSCWARTAVMVPGDIHRTYRGRHVDVRVKRSRSEARTTLEAAAA